MSPSATGDGTAAGLAMLPFNVTAVVFEYFSFGRAEAPDTTAIDLFQDRVGLFFEFMIVRSARVMYAEGRSAGKNPFR
jgi:hypothetical protein